MAGRTDVMRPIMWDNWRPVTSERFKMCRHSLCISLTAGEDRVILLESTMKPRNSIDWFGSMIHFLPFSRNPSDCRVDETYSD